MKALVGLIAILVWLCLVLVLGNLLAGCATSAPGPEWVTPTVLRGPQPSDWAPYKKAGVEEIVKLNCDGEGDESGAELAGMRVWRLCIPPRTDRGPFEVFHAPDLEELQALDYMARWLASRSGPMALIHCTHGCDRTGLLATMVRSYAYGLTRGQARWYLEHAAGGCYHKLPATDWAFKRWADQVRGRTP